MIKYTQPFLQKIEALLAETPYILRYEKGNFQSGYCVLKDTKVIIVNKFFPLEGRINTLIDIINTLDIDVASLSDKNKLLYESVKSANKQMTTS